MGETREIKAVLTVRSDTATNWANFNPVLRENEIGFDQTNLKFKIGDGSHGWTGLSFVNNDNIHKGTSSSNEVETAYGRKTFANGITISGTGDNNALILNEGARINGPSNRTVFGFNSDNTGFLMNHPNYKLILRGSTTRPYYLTSGSAVDSNTPTLALYSDIAGLTTGASSSTDNAVARFDGTTGKVIQNSNVTIADTGSLTIGGTWTDTSANNPYLSMGGYAKLTGNTAGAFTFAPSNTPSFLANTTEFRPISGTANAVDIGSASYGFRYGYFATGIQAAQIYTTGSTIKRISALAASPSTTYTYTLPNATGTIALTSDIPSVSSYVAGPSSSTDNAIARYDGTTGKLIQNSGVSIDDSSNLSLGENKYIYMGGTKKASFRANANGAFIIGAYDKIYFRGSLNSNDSSSASSGITFSTGTIAPEASSGTALGDSSHKWTKVFATKLNNGADITIPNASGTMALVSDIPSDYVDLSTDQTIEGIKSFTNRPTYTATRLPSEYQEVQYLYFDGSSGYVDTGVTITKADSLTITMTADLRSYSSSKFATFFGFMASATTPRCAVSVYQGKYMIGIDSTTSAVSNPSTGVCDYKFYTSGSNQILEVNNVAVVSTTYSSSALNNNTLTTYVGARNSGGTANNFADINVYKFKIIHNGTSYNFVPCYRVSDDKPGFYDTINNTFKPASGTVTVGSNIEDSEFLVFSDLAEVATTGSYNDLSDKPTIPTVNNATLTIKANGTSKGTFTANASSNVEINITASDLGLSAAMKFIGTSSTTITDGATTSPITVNNSSVTPASGNVVLYGNKEFVWTGSLWEELGNEGSYALSSVTITGTGALSGGGSLENNREITHNEVLGTAEPTAAVYKITMDKYGHVASKALASAADLEAQPANDVLSNLAAMDSMNQTGLLVFDEGEFSLDTTAYISATKSIRTDYTTAQSTSTGESVTGSGTIALHKIAKTGTYSDLIGTPELADVATSGSYEDLIDLPTLPTVGTLNTTATTAQTTSSSESFGGSITLHKVSKTGSYNDLLNKPTIPTVNNATLTIKQNDTSVGTFTANASSDVAINIETPQILRFV